MQELNRRRFQTKACIAGARTFLMLFNVIFWIVGLILLLCGLWMSSSIGKIFQIIPHLNFALPSLLFITGSLMMVIGIIACFCSSTESSLFLYLLSAVFFLIFGLIFATSITGYIYRDTLKHQLHRSLNESIQEYGNGSIIDKDWDRIQTNFACCGVDSYDDWKSSNWHLIYTAGCYPAILNLLTENISSLALGTFLISIFQLCGVTLAICLANHINKAHYEEMY